MSEPFIAEIRMMSFNFRRGVGHSAMVSCCPLIKTRRFFRFWALRMGETVELNFALPDLRGRVPVSFGSGIGLGEKAGEENHTLNISELPSHTHTASGVTANGNTPIAPAIFWLLKQQLCMVLLPTGLIWPAA